VFWIFVSYLWSDQSEFVAVFMALGTFTTLQKVTLSFVVRDVSACMVQLGSHWLDFHEI
jgi:hypothetical protein